MSASKGGHAPDTIPMFEVTTGRAAHEWADSLRRWDTIQRLQKGKVWTPAQYKELIGCCFKGNSVGMTHYKEHSTAWLAAASAEGATKTFLELVQEGFLKKFGEPTEAENEAWTNMRMDPRNQTPSAYAMEVKTRGELMLQFGRINKSEIICKFLDTLPPELQSQMEHYEYRHSLYTGDHDLQSYANEADTLWQAISQKKMDKRRQAASQALETTAPRKQLRDRNQPEGSQRTRGNQQRDTKGPGNQGKENPRPVSTRGQKTGGYGRNGSPDSRNANSKPNSRQPSPHRASSSQAPKEKWTNKTARFQEAAAGGTGSKPLGLGKLPAEAKASVAQYLREQGERNSSEHIATAGYYDELSDEGPISFSSESEYSGGDESDATACAVRARLPRSFRTLPITINPPRTLQNSSIPARQEGAQNHNPQPLARQLQELLPAIQQLQGLLPAMQQLLSQTANPAPPTPAPVTAPPVTVVQTDSTESVVPATVTDTTSVPAPVHTTTAEGNQKPSTHRYGTRFQLGVPVPPVNAPQALMSDAQWDCVQGHTAKANRLPYFKPTRDPQRGFRVKVRGKPINVQLPLIDSGANVCMISSNLVAQHRLRWTKGHAPVTSSVGQTSALGMLDEPIDLHLCEGTPHAMHLTAGGSGGLVTMVTGFDSSTMYPRLWYSCCSHSVA